MEATGNDGLRRRRRRRRRAPDFAWLRRYWIHMILGAVFALGFLFAKMITRA